MRPSFRTLAGATAILVVFTIGCANRRIVKAEPLTGSRQVLLVTSANWDAPQGTLQRFERKNWRGHWKAVGAPVPVMLGKTGLGWGRGLHPALDEIVPVLGGPVKHEGDGKAPAGVFRLSTAFGYAADKQAGWKMPYVALTPSVECVDDTKSAQYNRLLDRSGVTAPDWNSSEKMLRSDELYRWGVFVDHNVAPPTPGSGSCIFLHIWRGPGQPTVGCTAMDEAKLTEVISWLDPARAPLLVQLPGPEYKLVRKRWKLPKTRD